MSQILAESHGAWEVGDLSDDRRSQIVICPLKITTTYKSVIDNRELDDESIEKVSCQEDSDDEVFLGYFTVDFRNKERPIPAPRRLL